MGRGKGTPALDRTDPQPSRSARRRARGRSGGDQRLLSVRETADLGGITLRSVNKAIEQGVINAQRIEGRIRIPETELAPVVMIDEISKSVPLALSQKRTIRDWISGLYLSRLRGAHELELAPERARAARCRDLAPRARRCSVHAGAGSVHHPRP